MLNIRFLACTKVELWDLTVCIAVQSRAQYRTCLVIFIYQSVFKFHVPGSIPFLATLFIFALGLRPSLLGYTRS